MHSAHSIQSTHRHPSADVMNLMIPEISGRNFLLVVSVLMEDFFFFFKIVCNSHNVLELYQTFIENQEVVAQLVKQSACNAGDLGSILGLGRFPWRREKLPTPVFWPGEFHG